MTTDSPIDFSIAENKRAIFAALRLVGIEQVVIEYGGGGDSGEIEDVAATPKALTNEDKVFVRPLPSTWGTPEIKLAEEVGLRDGVESFAWDLLEYKHGGWENNDGGRGTITFDVATETVTLDHNTYFTDSTNDTSEI